jgi:hypothetical protein
MLSGKRLLYLIKSVYSFFRLYLGSLKHGRYWFYHRFVFSRWMVVFPALPALKSSIDFVDFGVRLERLICFYQPLFIFYNTAFVNRFALHQILSGSCISQSNPNKTCTR